MQKQTKEKPYQLFLVLGYFLFSICFYFLCDLGIFKSNKWVNELILEMNCLLLILYLIVYWGYNEAKKLFDYLDNDNADRTNDNK